MNQSLINKRAPCSGAVRVSQSSLSSFSREVKNFSAFRIKEKKEGEEAQKLSSQNEGRKRVKFKKGEFKISNSYKFQKILTMQFQNFPDKIPKEEVDWEKIHRG